MLARAANRLRKSPKGESTSDTNIVRRQYLLIDTDARRPAGISATDAEHSSAIERAHAICGHLSDCGWPEPVVADSGNGGNLVYRIDLPADDGGLIQRCLAALAARFDDDAVSVDQTVFNPARIWKLYGTLACKGDDTPDRPHRMARILSRPAELGVVDAQLLEALAAECNPPATTRDECHNGNGNGKGFDLEAFIARNNLDTDGPTTWNGKQGPGRQWTLRTSPMCEHHDDAAHIEQHASGAISAGCHHNSCSWGWADLRARLEPKSHRLPSVLSVTSDEWDDPAPLPDELARVERFYDSLLPESLRPWITDIAERMQCPPDYPAVASMVVLAGIVGRKIGIRPKRYDDWLIVPNLWGAVIGRPGLMKTPAIVEPLKVLKRLEIEAKDEYDNAVAEHEVSALVADARKDLSKTAMKTAIKKGDDPTAFAAELLADVSPAPVRQRYLVNDSTVEKLGEILNENPDGVTVYRDELIGLLKSLDKDGQEGSRAFYLEAWNGAGRYTYDRIGRGTIDIIATTVSIIGGIQPGPLAGYQRAAVRGGAGDDGLMQRFQLAVWPDCPNSWQNVDRWPDTASRQRAFETYLRLNALDPAEICAESDDDGDIPFLRFNADAQELFDEWRARLERRLREDGEHPAIESHLAKYRSLIPSIALLIHLADSPSGGAVSRQALEMAIRWGKYLESHARRIFAHAVNGDIVVARALAKKIEEGRVEDGFAVRDVYRQGWSLLATQADAKAATDMLVDLNWLREETQKTTGRGKTLYRIHPKILNNSADIELTKPTKAPSVSSGSTQGQDARHCSNHMTDIDEINARLVEAAALDADDEWGEV